MTTLKSLPIDKDKHVVVMVTGHRKVGGEGEDPYDWKNKTSLKIKDSLHEHLTRLLAQAAGHEMPLVGISGLALGFDQLACEVYNDLHIPWYGYVPCLGQHVRWGEPNKHRYATLVRSAAGIVWPNGKVAYSGDCMQGRNCAMVDSSRILLALWNGEGRGGTTRCLEYAATVCKAGGGLRMWRLDPNDINAGWFPLHPAGVERKG